MVLKARSVEHDPIDADRPGAFRNPLADYGRCADIATLRQFRTNFFFDRRRRRQNPAAVSADKLCVNMTRRTMHAQSDLLILANHGACTARSA
jgi:hypothetical protein